MKTTANTGNNTGKNTGTSTGNGSQAGTSTGTNTGTNAGTTGRSKPSKTDQLIHHIYCKTAQLITHARIEEPKLTDQIQIRHDKWFNLEFPDPDYFKEELKTWKSISSILFSLSSSSASLPLTSRQQQPLNNHHLIPVLIFETILDIQALPPNSFLTLTDSNTAREHSIDHRIPQSATHLSSIQTNSSGTQLCHKNIVIERWSVSLLGPIHPQPISLEPPTIYRHSIIHFRALYSYLRTMPASTLFQRLKESTNPEHGLLKIGCRISTAHPSHESQIDPLNLNHHHHHHHPRSNPYPHPEIGIFQDLSNSQTHCHPDSISTFEFPSIHTPLGSIKTRVIYRNQIEFRIGDKERVLSSRFRHEDQLERPPKSSPSQISAWMANYRTASSKLNKFGSSVPISSTSNNNINYSEPHPPRTNDQSQSISPNLPSGLYSSNNHHYPLTSYGSLSSRHNPAHKPPNFSPFDQLFTPVEKPHSDSLTAEILSATESSPFATATQTRSSHNGNGTGNSSALTAKLAAHRQSLPPVLSNALPIPSSMNRINSSSTTPTNVGNIKMTGSNAGASPQQFSILSSSPRSGPSSSIRISSGLPYSQQTTSNPAQRPPGSSAMAAGGPSGSSYPPFSGPLSPVPADSSLSTQRSGPSGQPMMRRYSSSRHSRSFGQASSSGGTSLLTGDSGGSLGRRALLNSSGFDDHHRKSSEDSHRNDINQFLKLIDSSQTIPSDRIPNRAHQLTRPAHLRYQKRIREAATKNEETHEQDAPVEHTAMTIEEEREYENDDDEDDSLSKLVKEQLELTLKELAGSVLPISEEPAPMAGPSLPAASGSQHSPHFGVPSGRSHYESGSGPADRPPSSASRKGKGRSGSFHLPSPGLATLHGLREEDEPLEPRQSFLPLLPISSRAIDLRLPHLHSLGDQLGDMQIGDHTDQQHTSGSNSQHYDDPSRQDGDRVDQRGEEDETYVLDPMRIEL
ncbi:hypothetical protein PCANC_15313 [Puccinia coronata f. sp. avenae]|uniref:Autophagy-related protein 13 n=1 Tax=Puccinia coronata f. sp. avenae TaxID=200324 RepID=A0A2N5STT6_9BASI|nr:hypothetical protein PCASD_17969 [Puccinia coronata f. sp. avenae]PLW39310.1 hypothetical protein PCANC_15313 [Puccinia coronata f. sp. avenae]